MADELKRCPCCKGLGTNRVGGEVTPCVECGGAGKVKSNRAGSAMPCANWSMPIGEHVVARDSMYSVDSGCTKKPALLFD